MTAKKRFVLCVDNSGYEASLITRKVYEVIPDAQAEKDDFIRIIDESGEDYLHHVSHFVFIQLPAKIERALATAYRATLSNVNAGQGLLVFMKVKKHEFI